MKNVLFYLIIFFSKILNGFIKIFKKRGGTYISGAIAYKLMPDFLSRVKNIDRNKVIFITGTNGKSTTTNLIVKTLENLGKTVASNLEGANLTSGAITTVLKNITLTGKLKTEYLVIESDERYLQITYPQLKGGHLIITNLQKDQMQRSGTPEFIYNKVKETVKKVPNVYLNADEPISRSLAKFASGKVYTYGIAENDKSFKKDIEDISTYPCYNCSSKMSFDYFNLDNIGGFRCTSCGYKKETPDFNIEEIDFESKIIKLNGKIYSISYPMMYFQYTYAMAIALLTNLGFSYEEINGNIYKFKNIQGRIDDLEYNFLDKDENVKTKNIKYHRIKQGNSETLQTVLDIITEDEKDKTVVFFLNEIEDYPPYFTSAFYIFDVNLNKLKAQNPNIICFGRSVAYDVANKLKYENFDQNKLEVIESNDGKKLFKTLESEKYGDNIYLILPIERLNKLKAELNEINTINLKNKKSENK